MARIFKGQEQEKGDKALTGLFRVSTSDEDLLGRQEVGQDQHEQRCQQEEPHF